MSGTVSSFKTMCGRKQNLGLHAKKVIYKILKSKGFFFSNCSFIYMIHSFLRNHAIKFYISLKLIIPLSFLLQNFCKDHNKSCW